MLMRSTPLFVSHGPSLRMGCRSSCGYKVATAGKNVVSGVVPQCVAIDSGAVTSSQRRCAKLPGAAIGRVFLLNLIFSPFLAASTFHPHSFILLHFLVPLSKDRSILAHLYTLPTFCDLTIFTLRAPPFGRLGTLSNQKISHHYMGTL
jgi:hypothetical protein